MDDVKRGLYGKYNVERVDGKPLRGGQCIVLELGDRRAWPALLVWAASVELSGFDQLAADVRDLIAGQEDSAARPIPPLISARDRLMLSLPGTGLFHRERQGGVKGWRKVISYAVDRGPSQQRLVSDWEDVS